MNGIKNSNTKATRAFEFQRRQMEMMEKLDLEKKYLIDDNPGAREKMFARALFKRRLNCRRFMANLFHLSEPFGGSLNKKILWKIADLQNSSFVLFI
jgi:hypothetical protein